MSKIALVTGAGSGIGRAVARTLHQEGYTVILVGRRTAELERTARGEDRYLVAPTDVTDPAAVELLFERIENTYRRLDLLFNNAGQSAPGVPFDELTWDQWKQVVDVNLNGAFLCANYAFGLMKRQSPRGGRIINNGSISAYAPRPNSAPYTATKHAISGLTKALALDGRAFDIAVGQLDIGNALTEMARPMTQGVRQANGQIAVEPTMDVRHVAEALLHMAALPLSANVLNMTVMATSMPFVGRG